MSPRPLPFTLYPKKTQMVLLFLVCLAFVAGGVLMIREGRGMGWLAAGFFGLGLPVFLIQLLPGSAYLTVDKEGFEFCSLFRKHRLKWSDIAEFGTYTLRQQGLAVSTMVGFNFAPEYARASKARAFSRALAGFEGGLPDTYGLPAGELAEILSDLHRQWSRKSSGFH